MPAKARPSAAAGASAARAGGLPAARDVPLLRRQPARQDRRGRHRDPRRRAAPLERAADRAREGHLPRLRDDLQPPAPFHVIPRGRIGPSLLAMILFAKYGDHQPLNRQSERYAREGVELDVSTMADHVGAGTAVLAPLHELIRGHVLAAERLHGDDTTVPVLAKGKTITGRLWAYVRDDRPFGQGQTGPPAVLFHYSPDRRGEHPERIWPTMPGSCRPTPKWLRRPLRADTRRRGRASRPSAGRMPGGSSTSSPTSPAPARRRRHRSPSRRSARSTRSSPTSARSAAAPAADRLAYRREHTAPMVAAFEAWMKQRAPEALAPCRGRQGDGLHAQALAGLHPLPRRRRICLTNNAAERALRGVAMRRSLCSPSSSVCKHWNLVFVIDATRTACSSDRGDHSFVVQVGGPDLVRSARHDLLGGKDAVLDEPADAMVR